MDYQIFKSLFSALKEETSINVNISEELEIWNDATEKSQSIVNFFFEEFIFTYGLFHDLIEKSDAIGDYHELKLHLVNGNIFMEGKTYITGDWLEEDIDETQEKTFCWIFDKNGNISETVGN
jgi:hypothetical protein